MSQHRNLALRPAEVPETPPAPNAIDDGAILDAAYPLLLSVGPRRLTMADVARHTDVSRATLYRRWPNVRSLVAAMVTREWTALAVAAFDSGERDARSRLVGAVVAIAAATREHPLLRVIVELDPEFLLPYLLERRGSSTDAQLTMLAVEIGRGQADGSIRRGDPALLAHAALLATTSFVLSARALADDVRMVQRLDGELAVLLDRYLAP